MCLTHAQDWLQVPAAAGPTEDDIVAQSEGADQGTDDAFPANDSSIGQLAGAAEEHKGMEADWKRVNGMLYVPTTQHIKILPVSTHRHCIKKLC